MATRSDHALALAILLASVVNEFGWQFAPPGLQGDVSYLTAWPVTALLCVAAAWTWQRSRAVVAVCVAVALQSLPTAACSGLWLLLRWERLPGNDSCSAYLGQWALLLSGSAALFVLWRWPRA